MWAPAAYERLRDRVVSVTGYSGRETGGRLVTRCPAHEDRNPSLSITAIEGSVLLHCHGGCDVDAVLAALDLTRADLYDERKGATYRYDSGRIVHRSPDKRFRQSGDRSKVELYHLGRLRQAGPGVVYLVEGEKDVHAIEAAGGVATTAPMGAANFAKVDVEPLRGRHVAVIVDQDDAGVKWADVVAEKLTGIAEQVRFFAPRTGKDAADHIAAGHGLEEFEPAEQQARIRRHPIELDVLLGESDPPYDWLVPGLIERGDRIVLTGEEGQGKSTLLRQIAIQLACGIHPFGGADVRPLRVLYIELENGRRHTKRQFRTLRAVAGNRYAPDPGLHVECRPEGIDLLDADDGQWLLDVATTTSPDILIMGPIYKLASGDPTEERTARTVALWLDRVRRDADSALILEAHVPYAASNGKRRPERPYGASLWSRWPEFGIFLSSEGQLRHWRGQRDEREWPAVLQRGGAWPWSPVARERDQLWARIVEIRTVAGRSLSQRELVEKTGTSKGAVQRAIDEHKAEFDVMNASPDQQLWEEH